MTAPGTERRGLLNEIGAAITNVAVPHHEPPAVVLCRRIVVVIVFVIGAALLGFSLSRTPGESSFYWLTFALAAVWTVGAKVRPNRLVAVEHAQRGKDQQVNHANNEKTTDKATADATSAFCADFLGDLDTSTDAIFEAGVWGKGSQSGSAMLVVKRGPNAGTRFRLDQPVTSAGRHPESDIFLDDVSVSRRHAEFRRENGEYLVVDTGSLNGTYVNRKPVESVALASGDEIQMGKFRLVFLAWPTTH